MFRPGLALPARFRGPRRQGALDRSSPISVSFRYPAGLSPCDSGDTRPNMPDPTEFPQIQGVATAELAAYIALAAARETAVEPFLNSSLGQLLQPLGCSSASVVLQNGGEWQTVARVGGRSSPPVQLLAEVLDSDAAAREGKTWACPLRAQTQLADALVLDDLPLERTALALFLAKFIGEALAEVRKRQAAQQRIYRLEAILEIAGKWNQTHEMEPLLVQMAEAATRLLNADRASIFLWDRPNKQLVGRPALGVKSGELRVPDNAGVVGRVVQTGEIQRVDRYLGQDQIDRRVDAKLGYQTQTLICVPLHGAKGERFGAFEVLNKKTGNFSAEDEEALIEMASHAAIALENTQELQRLLHARQRMTDEAARHVRMIGKSPAVSALRTTIERVAATELAVLILGENGTGKEVVSQSIHYLSERRDEPFIAVNCAAITETLLESELFGHEKGAFTGAEEMRRGKFELANGGTLFLDEIGDMSAGGQAKLLRVLEDKVVVRVGGATPIHTDARVIAATNQNLLDMVRAKKFREDLYFRLNVVTLELPPLRDRQGDIVLLAEHFLEDFSRKARRLTPKLSAEARQRLLDHRWPGNIRELRNLCERLAYLFQGDTLEAKDLALILNSAEDPQLWFPTNATLNEATTEFQIEYVRRTIERCGGNMTDAAEILGMHRSNLYRKLRILGVSVDDVT